MKGKKTKEEEKQEENDSDYEKDLYYKPDIVSKEDAKQITNEIEENRKKLLEFLNDNGNN